MSDEEEAQTTDESADAEPEADAAADAENEDAVESEAEADDEPAAEDEDQADGLAEDDFVQLDYTVRTVESGSLVDTTDESIAEDEGVDTENQEFGPQTVVLGAGHVFQAVEEDLFGKGAGDTGTVTVPAAEAFGEHDPDQVRTVSVDRIPEDSRYPGGHVDIDGQHGHVETVIGGRARVDFNHPLAGQDVEYEYEVLDTVEDRLERARGLLEMFVNVAPEMHLETEEEEQTTTDDEGEEQTETVEIETLYIESSPQLALNQQWLFSKQQIAQEFMNRLDIDRVVVREVFEGGGFAPPGMGGVGGVEDVEAALGDVEVDADDVVEELEAELGDAESEADESAASEDAEE